LYNLISQYVTINHDVIFDESINFNEETMVSRLDYGIKQMVRNQKLEMEDERILQQMKENPTMVGKDVKLFMFFFILMLMNPILLWRF
jgi:hypothetical protein